MEWNAAWPMLGAVLAALVGATGAYAGVVRAQRETARQQARQNLWLLEAEAYVDLINWTAWVEHWYIAEGPDPNERPLTVDMARTAARISAFGDEQIGEMAFELLRVLRPYVSHRDLVGQEPPPPEVLDLARRVTARARERLHAEGRPW